MKKILSKILALSMVMIMAMSVVAFADPAIDKSVADSNVTVDVTGLATGDEATLLVVPAGTKLADVTAEDILYIDQVTTTEGAAKFTFAMDTAAIDIYSGYTSMGVDGTPLAKIYEAPIVPVDKPEIDTTKTKLYTQAAPYGLTGYNRIFVKLVSGNGDWTATHSDENSAIYYSVEREGYDGLVKTEKTTLEDVLAEINWENVAPTDTIAMYGDISGDGKISAADYASIRKNLLHTVSYDLKQNLTADTSNDGKISAADYAAVRKFLLHTLTEFVASADK